MFKLKLFESLRRRAYLGIDELDFLALSDSKVRISLGAYTYPIDPKWCIEGAVGLDCDLESPSV